MRRDGVDWLVTTLTTADSHERLRGSAAWYGFALVFPSDRRSPEAPMALDIGLVEGYS
jgi:hypothetical protein